MSQVAVVGAGIVGVSIAFELQRNGFQVVLIDRDRPGMGASYGNMASVAVTEFLPSSRPSVWSKMPFWLIDPNGPVSFRAGYMPKLMPWLARFIMAGLPSRVRQIEAAGAVLCKRVHGDLLALLKSVGLMDVLSREGCLSLYANDAEFDADRDHIDVLERYGLAHEVLDCEAARDLEPALSPAFSKVVLFPENLSIRDPFELVTALCERFEAAGGRVLRGEVVDFTRTSADWTIQFSDGRAISTAQFVISAGAYSGRLSAKLGEPIPLETERGYHTQLSTPGVELRHSLIWPARAFMVTPTAGGLRIGGTVEMAGLDAAPNFRRAKVLVRHAEDALPGLQTDQATEWMGHRPALPDTLPIIGSSEKNPGVFYATGHGHLGLTYAATTARLIADLVCGRVPPIDMAPYRVNRF
ncbi:MAG: FAD-binding oxidoreductase [Rhizobiaceae bacterium]